MGGRLDRHQLVLDVYQFLEDEQGAKGELSSQQLLYVASSLVSSILDEIWDGSHKEPAIRFGYYSRDVCSMIKKNPFLPLSKEYPNMMSEFDEENYHQKSFSPKLVSKRKRRM